MPVNATSVMPRSTARSTANDVGLPTATTAGMPTTLAF
jgi:hypothetical protein